MYPSETIEKSVRQSEMRRKNNLSTLRIFTHQLSFSFPYLEKLWYE